MNLRSYVIFLPIVGFACAGYKSSEQTNVSTPHISNETREELEVLASSIVCISTDMKYEIYEYDESGTIVTTDDKTLSGGGLIINIDLQKSRYTVLTSKHLVAPKETTDVYFLDEKGSETDQLFAQYIIADLLISVCGLRTPPPQVRVIATNEPYDLALLNIRTKKRLGIEFPNEVGYDEELSWGDWVFVFGFPKGIKQIIGGLVSKSPYPNKMAVGAVVRFGYSGGPVFAIPRSGGKLALVGLIESVPLITLEFIAHERPLPRGYRLDKEDLQSLNVEKKNMVDYGTAYFVTSNVLKDFLRTERRNIEAAGIRLDEKFYR